MIRLILGRIVSSIPLIVGLVTIVFIIIRLLPGDPLTIYISPAVPPGVAEQLRTEFGFDRSIMHQYGQWLWGVMRGELGFSFAHQKDVAEVITTAFPNTLILAAAAILFQLIVGILFGLLAVRFRESFIDKIVSVGGLIVYTLPSFWVAILLLYVFSYTFGILPSSQMHSVGADEFGKMEYLLDLLKHLILPATVLGLPGAAAIARYLRTNLLDVLNEQFILTARSIGLNERKLFLSYALPNALIPTITITGTTIGILLAGAIVTETIFSWPGMGRLTVAAIFARDYPLIIGCTLIAGIAVIIGNLLADIMYRVVDPRIRPEGS